MSLPIVYLNNRARHALNLSEKFPGRLGVLYGPAATCPNSLGLPFVMDNGRYQAWAKQKKWQEAAFLRILSLAAEQGRPPEWMVVPDVVANPVGTVREWGVWAEALQESFGWPLAVAVQDGMVPADVKRLTPQPAVIFVGGTTEWKWRTLSTWTKHFPRVHVGRVNSARMLWRVQEAGAESSDGTGWWYGKNEKQLCVYLQRSNAGVGRTRKGFFY